jgi:hypothetical protein
MRRVHCVVLLVALLALTPVLAGCAGSDNDKFDIFNLNKKEKLKGERKELFPEGVPGVTQGVPPEYLKNTQPQPNTAQMPPALPTTPASGAPIEKTAAPPQSNKTAAVEPVAEPKPKPKPKHKPKTHAEKHPVAQTPAQPAAQKQTDSQQQPLPWPDQQQTQSPWPAQAPRTGTSPWPSAPPPGTFSR